MSIKRKLSVERCEVCGFDEKSALHAHHMIPRIDENSTDTNENIAIVCANCHNLIHACEIILEGRFLTSSGNKMFWHKRGEPHHIIPGIILNPDGTAYIKWS